MRYAALFVAVASLAASPWTRDLIVPLAVIVFLASVWRGPRSSEVVDS